MMATDCQAWRPGYLAAGAVHPECDEWGLRFMGMFIGDAATRRRPDVSLAQLKSMAAMHRAAMETDLIIRELTS